MHPYTAWMLAQDHMRELQREAENHRRLARLQPRRRHGAPSARTAAYARAAWQALAVWRRTAVAPTAPRLRACSARGVPPVG